MNTRYHRHSRRRVTWSSVCHCESLMVFHSYQHDLRNLDPRRKRCKCTDQSCIPLSISFLSQVTPAGFGSCQRLGTCVYAGMGGSCVERALVLVSLIVSCRSGAVETRRTSGGIHVPIVRSPASRHSRRSVSTGSIGLGDFEDM